MITLRHATPNDIPVILRFVRELAEYEREPNAVVATEAMLHKALFEEGAVASAVLAEQNDEPIGFAVYFFSFSTWLGRPGLYLEDLYVTPAARGIGAGKKLLLHLAKIAVERECGRMEWAVLDWNTPAIDFYKSVGATPMHDWTVFRLEGETLARCAGEG